MEQGSFMSRMRSFLGLHPKPPRNDFRNPIWGSDDDDDGDELYSRQQKDLHNHLDLHQELTRHMHEMFQSFGGMFGDMKSFFNDDFKSLFEEDGHNYNYAGSVPHQPPDSDQFDSNSIRNFYLKPGYHSRKPSVEQKDVDLDGKLSSQEISGLLKRQEEGNENNSGMVMPFDGTKVPGRSFCKTIITTSVTKPDGTIETRRIVKSGNEVIEETTTSSPDVCYPSSPNPGLNTISSTGMLLSELASIFKNFY
ncbi:hypothetical protein O0L34_g17394 [Tuta absoluta]|nr:hypothetical protein O0L34_g17394 [Tuta absoluta]